MFFMPGLSLGLVALAIVIATVLIVKDQDRVASLWRRALLVATIAIVPRLVGNEPPLFITDGAYLGLSAIASASLLAAFLMQSARAVHSGRRVQLGVGIAGAAAALLSGLRYFAA